MAHCVGLIYKIAGLTVEDSQCLLIPLYRFTIFMNACYIELQVCITGDCLDTYESMLLGNIDSSVLLLLFPKSHVDRPVNFDVVGMFNTFERSHR